MKSILDKKYVILAESTRFEGQKVALVDRSIHKNQWWTEDINKSLTFSDMESAQKVLSKLRFNNPCIYKYENAKERLSKAIVKQTYLQHALDMKVTEWHDDDWDEGGKLE